MLKGQLSAMFVFCSNKQHPCCISAHKTSTAVQCTAQYTTLCSALSPVLPSTDKQACTQLQSAINNKYVQMREREKCSY